MNYDRIVKEWFYRLPKGYAEAPYSDAELKVLDQVLTEHNISLKEVNQLDRAFNDAEPVEIEVEEILDIEEDIVVNESTDTLMEGYTKEDLITVIKETPLPDKLIAYISRLIDSANSQTSAVQALKTRNFDDKTSKSIFDKAVEMDSYKQLQDLVTGQAQGIDFDSLGTEGNLTTAMKKIGFSDEYLDWLYNYRLAQGGVNVGAGENMLRVILKGGHVPTTGDVGAEDLKIELKSTQTKSSGFRMRGQSGYGSGYDVALTVFDTIEAAYGDELPENFPDVTKDTSLQLYYKSAKESLADQFMKDLKSKNKISTSDIADAYTAGLKKLYKNYSGDIKADVVEPSIRSNGSIDISELFPRLAALEFKYYADSEPWDVFMVLNFQKDYLIMKKDSSLDDLAKIFKDNFNIGAPNTKPKATSQDSMTAVQLKMR
jgi:hypothetical protein